MCSYVQWNVPGCKCHLACWCAEQAPWALALRDCKDLAWVLTQEWALSVHVAKTSTWALTQEWVLAQVTSIDTVGAKPSVCFTE